MEFSHKSVLLDECIEYLNIKSDGIYVDGTLGGAGHSSEIIKHLDKGLLIGIDQDKDALAASSKRLEQYKNIKLIWDNNSNIKDIIKNLEIDKVDGILLDLGVSSYQLDEGERGFSYNVDADLDMRMNQKGTITAKDVVNTYSLDKLIQIISDYGEEKWAVRVAKFIVEYREKKEIQTTTELVEIIKNAIPKGARIDGPHPAKRTFQAIRIEVNDELNLLKKTVYDSIESLKAGGRICIITFHSLEDRIVKNIFSETLGKCTCPRELPICVCKSIATGRLVNKKPILPSDKELSENPRSRSAKLRVLEKL